ncbi:HD domain-containing protein [candidate division KSB1 bacterium]|nr:HD domain-containing protein [candidate division KSB1 bacterium]
MSNRLKAKLRKIEKMGKSELLGVIDVGASAIRLVIAEKKEKKDYIILESLSQPNRLGTDTFLDGKISAESAWATVKILKKFKRALKDYKVTQFRLVATSAVREAANRDYFIDYIYQNTGLKIQVIEGEEECQFIFLSIRNKMLDANIDISEPSLLLDLGTGTARIIFIKDGKMLFTQSLKLGSLRLREILQDIDVQSSEFHKVLRAFIQADIELIRKVSPFPKISRFIVTGVAMGDILQVLEPDLLQKNVTKVETNWFYNILDSFKSTSQEQFIEKFNVSVDKADVLVPTIIIYRHFIEIFNPDEIVIPKSSLAEGVILNEFAPLENFDEHIIASAIEYAKKFGCEESHAQHVMLLCESIFTQTRSLHGLDKSYLIILKAAALLHDIGHYVNDQAHHKHTQYLIYASSIIGLTTSQLAQIAVIARNHRRYDVSIPLWQFPELASADKNVLTKLIAILRIANALDRSHTRRVSSLKIKLDKDHHQVIFKVRINKSIPLEKWAFKHNMELFSKIFYVDCILREERILNE